MSEISGKQGGAPPAVEQAALLGTLDLSGGNTSRSYFNAIDRVALLSKEQVVGYAKDIEAGLFAEQLLQLRDPETREDAARSLAEDLERSYENIQTSKRRSANHSRQKLDEVAGADAVQATVAHCIHLAEASDPLDLRDMTEQGRQAKKIMVAANLRFVARLAQTEPRNSHVTFMDNVSAGNQGLIRGIEEYDYTLNFTVTTAVTSWIRKAIKEQYEWQSRTVRLTRDAVDRVKQLQDARDAYEQTHGTTPTPSQLAAVLKMPEARVFEVIEWAGRQPRSFNEPVSPDSGLTIEEALASTPQQEADQAERLRQADLREAIEEALDLLNDRERQVIAAYYLTPPDAEEAPSLSSIAKQMGITAAGASYLHLRALAKIRDDPALGPQLRQLLGHPPLRA
jgi:RNA polymerase sigma factor (sigma-70 family)